MSLSESALKKLSKGDVIALLWNNRTSLIQP